ncbi:Asp-tRNA(Asn)/Glu-tRNA(Gln) amidotransferase subunit GatB [Pelagicoccus sp. SDUM812003]|uniref:Asp-tRNA(Asn)/Glu-tRNA(Gln) amidotransferase subunit GatB n=1 Tax=Pelagicoccus sp. SDUM812003 TaxID=3041267 RepID=UPI00280F45B0|nr:Asp-tRNA(Asn)/Glu-tRNA(Gln) amidotransferase subunit GatB [Pelagicoccus sp. SDUM812003]MDQ8203678.1 Asp-tRNA(Asn)/Glu-tRNA(Gln) amidotransferase subunit GatB [Pelagicoccus sp. SDUM812003]
MEYEAVIGLEVHVQIKTESKIFTRCRQGYGYEPNTLVDAVIMGLPGALPVMNKASLDGIIKAGLALNCVIPDYCKWDRKNYFYPDSPNNYQITQYDKPICEGGYVEIELPGENRGVMGEHKKIQLTRIHLENDVGKLNHFSEDSLVDYNRAGSSLMEIVSEPDMHSGEEAFAFLTAIRQTMIYCGISDCDMEKGQMRADANISVRPVGQKELGTKIELKNLNSITGVKNGIDYEIKRQISELKRGKQQVQATWRWNADLGRTELMREKEDAHDYRYFPDPDLMPVEIDDEWRQRLRDEIPELPWDKQRRFMKEYGLPYTITCVLVPDRKLSDWFESAAKQAPKSAQALGNLVANDLLREMGEAGISLDECKITPDSLLTLVRAVEKGVVPKNVANKDVFPEMFKTGETADQVIERKGLKPDFDEGQVRAWCQEAIDENPRPVEDFRSGNDKALNALLGPVMKKSRGKANPQLVQKLIRELLG